MQVRVRGGRVRHVIPDYPHPDFKLDAAAEEAQFVKVTFGSTAIAPRPAAVRSALKDPQAFDLIHFACHGSAEADNIGDAKIMLEGRIEGKDYIPEYIDALTVEYNANLRNPDGNRPMVFVNACQARSGRLQAHRARRIRPGVPDRRRRHFRRHAVVGGRRAREHVRTMPVSRDEGRHRARRRHREGARGVARGRRRKLALLCRIRPPGGCDGDEMTWKG